MNTRYLYECHIRNSPCIPSAKALRKKEAPQTIGGDSTLIYDPVELLTDFGESLAILTINFQVDYKI